jgi:hypothetical protein
LTIFDLKGLILIIQQKTSSIKATLNKKRLNMILVEQYGSNTYTINNAKQSKYLEETLYDRNEIINLLRSAIESGIRPQEFLDSSDLGALTEESGSLF